MDGIDSALELVSRDAHRDALTVALEKVRRRKESGEDGIVDADDDPPFVTLSREAGIDAHAVAGVVTSMLNIADPAGPPWVVWDRHRIEAVCRDKTVAETLEESLTESSSTWFLQVFSGLGIDCTKLEAEEFAMQRQVALLVRSLARGGRAVVVGCGGVYATGDVAGGVHARLVAPLSHRIAAVSRAARLSEDLAAAELRRVDREREATHRRFCMGKSLRPEHFSATFNTARLGTMCIAECIRSMVDEAGAAAAGASLAKPRRLRDGETGARVLS